MGLLFSGILHQFDGIASTLSVLFDVPNLSHASTVSLTNLQTIGLPAERVMSGLFVFQLILQPWVCFSACLLYTSDAADE